MRNEEFKAFKNLELNVASEKKSRATYFKDLKARKKKKLKLKFQMPRKRFLDSSEEIKEIRRLQVNLKPKTNPSKDRMLREFVKQKERELLNF